MTLLSLQALRGAVPGRFVVWVDEARTPREFMADAAQTLLAMAKDRPDPKIIADWIVAYLGKKPLDARRSTLASLAAEFSKPRPPTETRAAGLILRVVQKLEATIK